MLSQIKKLPLLSVLVIAPVCTIVPAAALQPETKIVPPPVTNILPTETAGVLLINTTATTWGTLNNFNPYPDRVSGPPGLPYIPTEIKFNTDIQPWIGEWAALTLLPQTNEDIKKTINYDSSTLMVAPVKDSALMKKFIEKLKTTKKRPPKEKLYKNITIIEWPAEAIPSPKPNTPKKPLPSPPIPDPGKPSDTNKEISSLFLSEEFSSFLPYFIAGTPENPGPVPLPPSIKPIPSPAKPQLNRPLPRIPRQLPGLAVAMLPGYIAIASSNTPLEQLIDTQTDIKPLANNTEFQRTLQHPEYKRSLVIGYLRIQGLAQLNNIRQNLPSTGVVMPTPPTLSPDTFKTLESVLTNYDAYLWVDDRGIRGQTQLHYKNHLPFLPSDFTSEPPNHHPVLSRLPANTYLVANSRNLKQIWRTFVIGTEGNPKSKTMLDKVRKFVKDNTGLDIDKDIMSWLDGEYGIALFPTNEGISSVAGTKFPLGVALIAEANDREKAQATLKKLDEFVKSKSGNSVKIISSQLQNRPATSWEIPAPKGNKLLSIFAHSWPDDNTVIITSGLGPLSSLNPPQNQSLVENFTFKNATDSFPRPNLGYFYVNMGSTLSFMYSLVPPEFIDSGSSKEIRNFLGIMRSISFSNSVSQEKVQADFNLVLSPVNKQTPNKPPEKK